MAAGLGFKTFTTGEVLTAADTNGYLMQGVLVFASSAARAAAITSPQEGQYSYLKDTNSTEYYDGAAWIAAPIGDITGVTAGTGISGGGTSGTVTITNSMATEIAAKGDLIVGTGAATFDNLTVGANGTTLVADSSTATGLKWAAASSGSQTLLSTTSLSGTSTTISSISQSYRALYIYGRDIKVTSGTAYLRIRWNGHTVGYYGNAAIAGAFSTYQSVRFANAGGVQDDNATRTSLDTAQNCQFYANFPEYTATGFKLSTGWFNPSYSEDVMTFAALNDSSTSAVTSFTVTTVAGTASMTGTIYIYGVN